MEPKYGIEDNVFYETDDTDHGFDIGLIIGVYKTDNGYVYEMKGKPNEPVKEKHIRGFVDPKKNKG